MLKTNGGSIPNDNTNEIVLKNIGKIINIDILYGVNTDNSCFDIEYWTKKYIDESNDENNVYIISNNFTEFLDMIVKR